MSVSFCYHKTVKCTQLHYVFESMLRMRVYAFFPGNLKNAYTLIRVDTTKKLIEYGISEKLLSLTPGKSEFCGERSLFNLYLIPFALNLALGA